MSSHGIGIVLICAGIGLVLSLVVCLTIDDRRWRRVIFCAVVAAAVLYVGVQPRGYDQWDVYAAIWYSAGALVGWFAGFGIATLAGRP